MGRSEESYVRDNLRRRCRIALEKQGIDPNLYSFDYVGIDSSMFYSRLRIMYNFNRKTHHVDHIIPLSRLDLSRESHRRFGFSYLNIQALLPSDNKSKHNHLPRNYDKLIKCICSTLDIKLSDLILKEIEDE